MHLHEHNDSFSCQKTKDRMFSSLQSSININLGNNTICTLSSDILAYVCTFVPSDRNSVDLFISCKSMTTSQFLMKVDLKGIYRQSDFVNEYRTLYELRKRIR
jgi:hypothetical protein